MTCCSALLFKRRHVFFFNALLLKNNISMKSTHFDTFIQSYYYDIEIQMSSSLCSIFHSLKCQFYYEKTQYLKF